MLGKLLKTVVDVVTLPVDLGANVIDIIQGGDGTKESYQDSEKINPLGDITKLRDDLTKDL